MRTDITAAALGLALVLAAGTPTALADDTPITSEQIGSAVTLVLAEGDRVSGTVSSITDESVTLTHAWMGDVTIAWSGITGVIRAEGEAAVPQTPEPAPVAAAPAVEEAPAAPPAEEDLWTGSASLGLNGSEGNTERLNVNAGLKFTREDEKTVFTIGAVLDYATEEGEQSANRFEVDARNEWKLEDSPWSIFVQGRYELDEFKEWDYRVSGGGGVGYLLIDEDDTTLKLRGGVGFSREFGDESDEETIPELILGADYEHKFDANQSIVLTGDIFPDLSNTGEFRSVSSAVYKINLPEGTLGGNAALEMGIAHRYESEVENDIENSDFDYFVRLVMNF